MSSAIHPTAFVEDGAQIGANVRIGPYCIVSGHSQLGDNVVLHSHVVVAGQTRVGENTQIYPFASLGHAPQDLKYAGEPSELHIGKDNIIREHVTMNLGTAGGGMVTAVGDHCLFMTGAHVAHDCIVGNHVIMANNATLGGHVTVGDHAVIGGLAAVHQFVRVGACAVIGGVSAVVSDVIPYGRVKASRAELSGLNIVGLERGGYGREQVRKLQRAYNQLFAEEGTLEDRINAVASDFTDEETVQEIIRFARGKTSFPLCQPPRKAG